MSRTAEDMMESAALLIFHIAKFSLGLLSIYLIVTQVFGIDLPKAVLGILNVWGKYLSKVLMRAILGFSV